VTCAAAAGAGAHTSSSSTSSGQGKPPAVPAAEDVDLSDHDLQAQIDALLKELDPERLLVCVP
jgi:hypothetical protein